MCLKVALHTLIYMMSIDKYTNLFLHSRSPQPSLNCFSTTPDLLLDDPDSDVLTTAHTIAKWYRKEGTASEAFSLIGNVLGPVLIINDCLSL